MVKERVELPHGFDLNGTYACIKELYKEQKISELDGLKIEFEAEKKWAIVRASNTEPVLRIYSEATTLDEAKALVQEIFFVVMQKMPIFAVHI